MLAAAVTAVEGFATTVRALVAALETDEIVTVQVSEKVPPAAAVTLKVACRVVLPAVIVPPVIVHRYVAPVWAGTVANKPVFPVVTEDRLVAVPFDTVIAGC